VERQLGGALALDWQVDGLTARISLPADQVAGGAGRGAVPADPVVPGRVVDSLNGRKVLVVEDEALIGLQIEQVLTGLGAHVVGPVATAAAALRLLAAERPEVAVLDLNLAGIRSDEVAQALTAAGVPFVLCTGYAEDVDLPPPLASAQRLPKPLQPDELAAVVAGLAAPAP
jgi:CheY-like chemotaxis protein